MSQGVTTFVALILSKKKKKSQPKKKSGSPVNARKAPWRRKLAQACCQWALLDVQFFLPCYWQWDKYDHPSVIILMRLLNFLKVQVKARLPKRGQSEPEHPEKNSWQPAHKFVSCTRADSLLWTTTISLIIFTVLPSYSKWGWKPYKKAGWLQDFLQLLSTLCVRVCHVLVIVAAVDSGLCC